VNSVGSIELPSRVGSRRTQAADATEEPSAPLPIVTETTSPEPKTSLPSTSPDGDHLQPSSPTTARLPFSGSSSTSRERGQSLASTSGSQTSSHRTGREIRTDRPDRPSSMGYVPSHLIQDNIHHGSPEEPSWAGSAAELVTDAEHGHGVGHGTTEHAES
jgi:hypothetical protein